MNDNDHAAEDERYSYSTEEDDMKEMNGLYFDSDVAGAPPRKLFVCGRLLREWDDDRTLWSFNGIFSTKEMAVDVCEDSKDFAFEVFANEAVDVNLMNARNMFFPKIEETLSGD